MPRVTVTQLTTCLFINAETIVAETQVDTHTLATLKFG